MLIKGVGTIKSVDVVPYKLWISKWSTIQSNKVKMSSESETWQSVEYIYIKNNIKMT